MTPCEARSVASTGATTRCSGPARCTPCGVAPRSPSATGPVTWPGAPPVRLMRDMGLHGIRRAKSPRTTRSAPKGAVPGRPGEPAFRRFQAERAVGVGHHICAYFQRLGVRGLRDGRLLPAGHRPADLHEPVRGPGRPGSTTATAGRGTGPSAAGRPWPSARRSPRWAPGGTPFGFALAEALNSLYKAELIRNRPRLDEHGPWEGIDDARAHHRRMGPLVQHGAPPLRHRHAHPGRARGRPGPRHRPPGTTTTDHHRNQLTEPPQNPGLDTSAVRPGHSSSLPSEQYLDPHLHNDAPTNHSHINRILISSAYQDLKRVRR